MALPRSGFSPVPSPIHDHTQDVAPAFRRLDHNRRNSTISRAPSTIEAGGRPSGGAMTRVGTAAAARTMGVTRLAVDLPGRIDLAAARRALEDAGWLGTAAEPPPDRPTVRRYLTDLVLQLSAGSRPLEFRKAALVDLGPVVDRGRSLEVEIGWRSATMAPLFPVFAGLLLVTPAGLVLEGAYAPPFGEAGMLVDKAALHFVARRTARWFLGRVGAELGMEPMALGREPSPSGD